MSAIENSSIRHDAPRASIALTVSTLRFADGALRDPAPFATVLRAPNKAARSRHDDQLIFFLHPTNAEALDLCQELHQVIAEAYWSTVGSVTAALRRAASLTNRHLFEHNLNAEPSDRCYGGLACAVLRQKDLFLLQAGPASACILQEDRISCFPRGEKLAHLGIGPAPDVRLHHIFAATGDTLLLASPTLLRAVGKDGLRRVLPRDEVTSVLTGLQQLAANADFIALVARWEPASVAKAPEGPASPRARRSEARSPALRAQPKPRNMREPVEHEAHVAERRLVKPRPVAKEQPSVREQKAPRKKLARELGKKLGSSLGHVARGLRYVWHAVAAAAAGVTALGRWLIGATATTIRRTLPGAEQKAYRRVHRRPPPDENRNVLIAVAVGIPLLVIAVVALAYLQLARVSRFEATIQQAEEQIAMAQAAQAGSEEARAHWQVALQRIDTAAALQPGDPSAQALREQVRDALDHIDQIERLTLSQLADFGSSHVERRLVPSDQVLFVLDSADGWGARVSLDRPGAGSESENVLVLLRTGQQVAGEEVGQLVDCAWAGREGGRQSGALLVLEKGGGLVSYDPAWRSETGAPHLARLELSAPLPGRPVAVGTYQGQFYVLDAAETGGQIWRYRPEGNAYPRSPEPYFETPPDKELAKAVDMAIDGHIYILYNDGTVDKFLGGELQQFEIRGVPGDIGEVAGLAVDPRGQGTIYVADRSHNRVVELHPDGRFKAQFLADGAFAALEALAVNEGERRLYVLDGGKLHVASLP